MLQSVEAIRQLLKANVSRVELARFTESCRGFDECPVFDGLARALQASLGFASAHACFKALPLWGREMRDRLASLRWS